MFASIFLALAIIISLYYNNDIGKDFDHNQLQKKVLKSEILLNDFIDNFIENHSEDNQYSFDNDEIENANEHNIRAFIIEKENLISWTHNSISPISESVSDKMELKKVDNQYCLILSKQIDSTVIQAIIPIYYDYPLTNEFLKNTFDNEFIARDNIKLTQTENSFPIYNSNSDFLFSLEFTEHNYQSSVYNSIILFLYFLFFIFLIQFVNKILKNFIKNYRIRILLFISFFVIIKILTQVFKIPDILYQTAIFSPKSFALNMLIPSLGDYLFIILIIFASIIYVFSEYSEIKCRFEKQSQNLKILSTFILILIALFGIDLLFYSVKLLILNSSINFDLLNPVNIDYLSIIAYIIISFNIISTIFLLNLIIRLLKNSFDSKKQLYIISAIAFLIHFIVFSSMLGQIIYLYYLFLIILILVIYFSPERLKDSRLTSYVLQLLIISLAFNFYINRNTSQVEKEKRLAAVLDVSMNQNPEAEYIFNIIETDVYKDSLLKAHFEKSDISYDSIINYIQNQYFNKYDIWNKFEVQITICDQYQQLLIKPENYTIHCKTFFYESLLRFGKLTDNNNLYFLEYGTGQTNYLGLLQFDVKNEDFLVKYTVYIEINSKLKREGYSKLLTESGLDPFEKIQDYSLARYVDSINVENYGNYNYPEVLSSELDKNKDYKFIDKNGYNHLIYRVSQSQYYVLSKENISDVNRFATFSYLFVIIIISFLFITLFFNKNIKLINFNISYSSRLQLTIIAILLFAFFIIGGISSYYIRSLNNDKNQEKAKDISGSLKIEFENKISKSDFPGMDSVDYLKELSIKFSKVFDTDINLFDKDGDLIASTRPRVFDYHLMSEKINPTAISAIKSDALPYFMNIENIGSMEFMSAYRPIAKDGELVAFINLPYFAKQSQQRKEITSFILTLLNVYTLIIIISLIIAIIVSSYITRPLQTLKNKMKAVNLGKTNEYIKWNKDDEIGQLIEEYNKMLKELENSAELLAQSERASAWKEMAKQVAHEIKNPLTPMRLHIQHVQKLVGTEGFEDKFKSMASNLIQQIDALAEIATAFSDFAKMPRFDKQKIELGQIIKSAAELNQSDSVDINLNFNLENEYYILSDQKQMLRVFNNLMNNSIQASKDNENQRIEIDLNEDKNNYFIKFKDYGVGISEDKKDKIFVPNFTTKSHGMGMGLAIVKSIIISSGGNISFESEAEKGTSFFIELPKYK